MKQQRKVETVEEFKLRIAAIVGDKLEHIAGAPQETREPPESKTSKHPLAPP